MRTKIIEAVQSRGHPGNWGKFLVGEPDLEFTRQSAVKSEFPGSLLTSIGWTWEHLWVLDLQTGEGAFFKPGGLAAADLEKHAIWVCPLFCPFLEWLYERYREAGELDLDSLPDLVELPGAEFSFHGHRRPGPAGLVRALTVMDDEAVTRAVAELSQVARERLQRALGAGAGV